MHVSVHKSDLVTPGLCKSTSGMTLHMIRISKSMSYYNDSLKLIGSMACVG
jgi:hypothetical protein